MNNSASLQFVLTSPQKLSNKITGLLVLFFLAAIVTIGLTLLVSWQLEGGAAAINDAGSQRMRSYRIGHLLARAPGTVAADVSAEVVRFDAVMRDLEHGDPIRPLSPPRDAEVFRGVQAVNHHWALTIKPIIAAYLGAGDDAARRQAAARYDQELSGFVGEINELVLRMERNYGFNTALLRTFQIILAGLAVIGTAILIRFFFVMVIRPVDNLYDGIRRMAGDDFSVRLPVETRDEFGVLAQGFNRMAEHLQDVYATLEQRVAAKTSSLEERNLELGLLYEVTAFLNEAGSTEELCQGFLKRVKSWTQADAGSVRLYSSGTEELFLLSHEGLSHEFLEREMSLRCGECLCGQVVSRGVSAVGDPLHPMPGMTLKNCSREGFRTASAFTICYNKHVLGVFNLYFKGERSFNRQEFHLLETLGQHLGVAVENQRLQSRERQLAVSEERNLLAQELHDSIAQGLAFLNIQVQLLQDSLNKNRIDEVQTTVEQIQEGVQESYEDVRELLVHFRTRMQQTDLDTAITTSLERFEEQTGIATRFDPRGSCPPLPPDEQIQVMHIVQESLSNIRKHAQATEVVVILQRGPAGMSIEVRDNGIGFDVSDNPSTASERHVGLKIMKERAQRVGGECRVESAPGAGTRVMLTLRRQEETV